jgi:trehalose 6-phosphate phosphatase
MIDVPMLTAPPLTPRNAVFLDFDGTLVDIAATPGGVVVSPALPALLQRLAQHLDGALAVISGRTLAELLPLLRPYAGAAAGAHGLEIRLPSGETHTPPPEPSLERIKPLLRDFAAQSPGVIFEDKGVGLSLHYRRRPDLAEACIAIVQGGAALSDGQLTARLGKMIAELLPPAANKGHAVVEFMRQASFQGRVPVCVGDDRTDENGFIAVNRLGGFSIHVGAASDSAAQYGLADVNAVIAWLAAFRAGLRPAVTIPWR